jgi:cell wall-associated NlpC family hydrolase
MVIKMADIFLADLIGKPFADGGRGPDTYDCWGLACEVFRRYGIILPDYQISCHAKEAIDRQVLAELPRWRRCDPVQPPAPSLLVLKQHTRFCNHTGVYLGAGRFLHTLEKTGAVIERTDHAFWKRKIVGYYLPGWL